MIGLFSQERLGERTRLRIAQSFNLAHHAYIIRGACAQLEVERWASSAGKSFGRNGGRVITVSAWMSIIIGRAEAQTQGPAQPGLNFVSVKNFTAPAIDVIAYPIYMIASLWDYMMHNPPAAVICSAALATSVAIISIRHQRDITRLKETFSTLDRDIWDNDLIKARYAMADLKADLKDSIARFSKHSQSPNKEDREIGVMLYSILNYYENISLAVRMGILDEIYLFRWSRTLLISDWDFLSPLVTALRHERKAPSLYVEFEGLASAWMQDRSYRTNKQMRKAVRKISVI